MIIEYLNNKRWEEISREERLFCAELYYRLKNDQKPFLNIIKTDPIKQFDIGFEVCFYRDLLKEWEKIVMKSVRTEKLPSKRTFDLVLLSEDEMIIIEAKANQGFDNKQLQYFEQDRTHLKTLFSIIQRPLPEIRFVAIHSDKYIPSEKTRSFFSDLITWKKISDAYPSSGNLFLRANEIYE